MSEHLAAWDHLRISLPSNTQLDLAAVVTRTKHLEVVPSNLQRHNTLYPLGAGFAGTPTWSHHHNGLVKLTNLSKISANYV